MYVCVGDSWEEGGGEEEEKKKENCVCVCVCGKELGWEEKQARGAAVEEVGILVVQLWLCWGLHVGERAVSTRSTLAMGTIHS